jgi:hypothetical protein
MSLWRQRFFLMEGIRADDVKPRSTIGAGLNRRGRRNQRGPGEWRLFAFEGWRSGS